MPTDGLAFSSAECLERERNGVANKIPFGSSVCSIEDNLICETASSLNLGTVRDEFGMVEIPPNVFIFLDVSVCVESKSN